MAKGKTKTIGNCGRSLRSRKKEGEEIEAADPTVDTPSPACLQDTKGNDTGVVAGPFSVHTNQQDPTGVESSPFKPRLDSTTEKNLGTTLEDTDTVLSGDVAAAAHEVTATHGHNADSQLGVPEVHSDVSKEEEALRKGRSLHIMLPGLVEGDGLCLTLMEKHIFAKVNTLRDLDVTKDADINTPPPDNEAGSIKEPAQEAAVSFPPKKKRRMGTCGLTEKERSQFFLMQKRENGQNRNIFEQLEEKQGCDDNTADTVTPEKTVSSPSTHPSGGADETSGREKEPQPVNSERNNSTKTEASSETNPACEKEGNTCEAEEHTGLHLNQPGPSAEEPDDKHSVNCEVEEQNRSLTESGKPGRDVSVPAQSSLQDSVHTVNTEEISTQESTMAAAPPVDVGEITGKEVGDPPAQAQARAVNCVQVKLCDSAVMPSVSGCEDKAENEDRPAPGSCPENNGHGQAEDATEPNGSDCLDYVSDSQLNTIDLIEDTELDEGQSPDSSCLEDFTNLICGLINELSSLNRKVMAAHRELENLRRSSRGSRGSRR